MHLLHICGKNRIALEVTYCFLFLLLIFLFGVKFYIELRDLNICGILRYNSKGMALHDNEITIMVYFTVAVPC